jgi:transcriptional regulator with XRE-family HTH domain
MVRKEVYLSVVPCRTYTLKHISRFESGAVNLTLGTMVAVAAALGVELADVFAKVAAALSKKGFCPSGYSTSGDYCLVN